jgi:hypothetical protein
MQPTQTTHQGRRLNGLKKELYLYWSDGAFEIIYTRCLAAPSLTNDLERPGLDSACDVFPHATLQSLLPFIAHQSSTFLETRPQDGIRSIVPGSVLSP